MLSYADGPVTIVGAGPAGLSCAIHLARAGWHVVVREWHDHVAARFHGDFQGLENWTSDEDALDELSGGGLAPTFESIPVSAGVAYDANHRRYSLKSKEPLYYLVRRGATPGCLDASLLKQAQDLGVDVRFGDRARTSDRAQVLAIGPRTADAIAAGYVFNTDMADGSWLALDNRLAPFGYAYLLVYGGRGTVASCMFGNFRAEATYVERTVAFFREHAGLAMDNPVAFGGYANFRLPRLAHRGDHLIVGEQAGFQDALAGFGMRYAMRSGVLAAQSLLTGIDYTRLWRRQLLPLLKAGTVNRFLYNFAGSATRSLALEGLARTDARRALRRSYNPSWATGLLFPLARLRFRRALHDPNCRHVDCNCVWCRCAAGGTGHIGA